MQIVCTTNYWNVPTMEEVRPWLKTICRLLDDEKAYAGAVEKAKEASKPFHPDRRKEAVVKFFESLLT